MKAVGKERVDILIELVRKNPIIYDRSHEHFRNKDIRDRTWQHIADKLKIERTTIMLAWNSMRDRYRRTMMRRKGFNLKKDYRYAPKMGFLLDHIHLKKDRDAGHTRNGSDTLDYADDNAGEDSMYDEEDGYYRIQLQDDELSSDSIEDKKDFRETHRDDPFSDVQEDDSLSPPPSKKPLTTKASEDSSGKTEATNCEGCSGARQTYDEAFLKALSRLPLHPCAQEEPLDQLDRFFLTMSSSVKETNITGIELLRLKSKMMYHLLEEVTKIIND